MTNVALPIILTLPGRSTSRGKVGPTILDFGNKNGEGPSRQVTSDGSESSSHQTQRDLVDVANEEECANVLNKVS